LNPSKYAFQAGLFILLSIAAGIYLIAQVAESRNTPGDATRYVAVFPAGEDVSGISEGAEVRLLGVKVGTVEAVTIAPPTSADEDATVRVTFSVGNGVELRQGNPELKLQTAVTGGAWLNILSVGTGQALAEGSEVPGSSENLVAMIGDVRDEMQITLAAVREEIDVVSAELVQTADSIERSADGVSTLITAIETDIDSVLTEASALMTEGTGVMSDIRAVFGDSGEDIRTTLANLNTLTTDLNTSLPETLTQINGFVDRTRQSIDGVDELITELTGTAAEARALITSNRPNIDRTLASARRSVDELEGLVDDLRANPSRLIWPPDENDLNNMDLYATARSYANAAEDLQSAAEALQAASENGVSDPDELEALRTELMQQFEHFDSLQTELWQRFEK